jgi:hypothetical protein
MRKPYYKKTFRIEPDTYKRLELARMHTKRKWGVSWDVFFNELMDIAGIEKINKPN